MYHKILIQKKKIIITNMQQLCQDRWSPISKTPSQCKNPTVLLIMSRTKLQTPAKIMAVGFLMSWTKFIMKHQKNFWFSKRGTENTYILLFKQHLIWLTFTSINAWIHYCTLLVLLTNGF